MESLLSAVVWCLVAVFIGVVAYDAGYERGAREGGDEVYAAMRARLFSAMRRHCDDPRASQEQRSGAWKLFQRAVRP